MPKHHPGLDIDTNNTFKSIYRIQFSPFYYRYAYQTSDQLDSESQVINSMVYVYIQAYGFINMKYSEAQKNF